jgi:hypothetical protein
LVLRVRAVVRVRVRNTKGSSMTKLMLEDRLTHGRFSMFEACELSGHCRAKLYADVWDRKLGYLKSGRSSHIPGPILRRYLLSQQVDDLVPNYPGLIIGPPSDKSRLSWKTHGGRRRRLPQEAAQCLP